ncbi:CoA transferase [Pseudomonas abieticivorans]|uniref:CoA transferase n=1 Tax=Pseudomonas abieticivorans TaxID=2931382 RepID=UPI0020BDBC78|nr:CoA transferase [Pseudomonas sp. PIA16]
MPELLSSFCAALDLPDHLLAATTFQAVGALPSAYAVTDFASASIAAAGLAVAHLLQQQGQPLPAVIVDRRLASFWFAGSLRPLGWRLAPAWDALAADYQAADGWIRLHTNARHHRASAEQVLGACSDRAAMAQKVAQWQAGDLESAIVAAGGCAAQMRSWAQWQTHPQGQAVNAEPLVQRSHADTQVRQPWLGSAAQPLAGIKVLDLTRILAGPVATRLLAGLGADVLRLDPPGWEEPSLVPEITLGKHCARLDLHDALDRLTFERLLGQADVLVHGYRGDALERLGYGAEERRRLAPGLIDVSLNAYGCSGPWRHRRGFDSLVQMSTGIAAAGMQWQSADKPVPLPVQALDHATGYLIAASVIRGLTERLHSGRGGSARLSLARTAKALVEHGQVTVDLPLAAETGADLASAVEHTPWGPAHRLSPPLCIRGTPLQWALPANELGSAIAAFGA